MSWKNAIRKGIEAGKALTDRMMEEGSPIREMLQANLRWELIRHGELFIPRTVLEQKIREQLAEQEESVRLESITCTEDNILLALNVKRYKARATASVTVRIREVQVDRNRQIAVCHISGEKIVGANVMGKVVAKIIQVVINDMVKTAVSHARISEQVVFSEEERLITIDLSALEPIRKMGRPVNSTNVAVLDLVSFTAFHRDGGIVVAANFSENIADKWKKLKERLKEKDLSAWKERLKKQDRKSPDPEAAD